MMCENQTAVQGLLRHILHYRTARATKSSGGCKRASAPCLTRPSPSTPSSSARGTYYMDKISAYRILYFRPYNSYFVYRILSTSLGTGSCSSTPPSCWATPTWWSREAFISPASCLNLCLRGCNLQLLLNTQKNVLFHPNLHFNLQF